MILLEISKLMYKKQFFYFIEFISENIRIFAVEIITKKTTYRNRKIEDK